MTFEQWLKRNCMKPPTEEARALAQMAWRRAEHNASMAEVDECLKHAVANFQKKRDKLKKQTTHMTGKYMIVKTENNKLRSVNKAITKRNTELTERVTYLETITHERVLTFVKEHYRVKEMKLIRGRPTTYKRVPNQC